MTVTLHPDLPWTDVDETRIEATYPQDGRLGGGTTTVSCGGAADAGGCGDRILPGDRFYVGAAASTGPGPLTSTIEIGSAAADGPPFAVHPTALCP
jgi:hypothetical protein